MEWLLPEHRGLRARDEILRDLRTIAAATDDGNNEVHALVDPDDCDPIARTGFLATSDCEDAIALAIDGEPLFVLHAERFRGAWLTASDGATYWSIDSTCAGGGRAVGGRHRPGPEPQDRRRHG